MREFRKILVNWFGKFVKNIFTKLFPLNELLKKKGTLVWSQNFSKTFEMIKSKITSDECFAPYNQKLELAIDASSYGLGGVLLHILPDESIIYIIDASRCLSKSEMNY